MNAPLNTQVLDVEKPLFGNSGSTTDLNDFSQALQSLTANNHSVKQCPAIVTYGDPNFNRYLIIESGTDLNGRELSNYLALPSYLLGSPEAVNYCAIMPDQKPFYTYKDYYEFNKRGFISFNLPSDSKPTFVYIAYEIEVAFKLSACNLPCVLVPPLPNPSHLVKEISSQIQERIKTTVAALENLGVQVYVPVPMHQKDTFKFLLNGLKAHVLPLPEGISQYVENSLIIKEIERQKSLANAYANKSTINDWGSIQPLGENSLRKNNVYPVEALPQLAKEAIEAIAHYVQAPISMAAQCVLATMSHIAQAEVNAPLRHKINGGPCSLFLLCEGESGSRKTGALDMANKSINDLEKLKYSKYQTELSKWHADENKTTAEPTDPSCVFSDATVEAITTMMISGDLKAASLSSDEAAQFFGGHSMKGDTRGNALGTLTKLFDSGFTERARAKSNINGSGKAYDVRLTFSLLGQHEILVGALNDPILVGQGFLPRFLFTAPESIAGSRLQSLDFLNESAEDDERLKRYWSRCKQLLAAQTVPQVIVDSANTNQRPVIPMSHDAKIIWNKFYNSIETKQGAGQRYEYLKAFASRSSEIAIRVATVFAYFEGKHEIDDALMKSACLVVQHSLNEWASYSDITTKAKTDASVLLEWLIKKCQQDKVAHILKTEIQQKCRPASVRKKQVLEPILEHLVDTNYVQLAEIHGKKYVVINPKCLSPKA